ncbi:MAG TPA: HAD family hydrolase, partial [Acidimicrobiales bacterium]|nr:HAD family hydrolase [Acidimicrobiales bacterium]
MGPVAWVLDLDGVVWLADQPLPGAAEAVARLRAAGERVVFVTNNSSERVVDQEAKLASFGIPAAGDVVTSAVVAVGEVAPGERVFVCAGPGVEEAVLARGAVPVRDGDADAVVVGFHRDFDYDEMDR